MAPMARPTIVPPWGSPKHSCWARLRSHLRDSVVPVCRLAPQFVHVVAVSSFLVPHLEQYTMILFVSLNHDSMSDRKSVV